MAATDLIIPIIVCGVMIFGLARGVDVFTEFIEGARENMRTAFEVMPALAALMTAVGLFKSSGALELMTGALSPAADALGFPAECLPLALIRPVSGSGATAVFEAILGENHPDGFAGRVASVLMGSTETTFYTIAVYFGVTKVKQTQKVLIAAAVGDVTSFVVSALTVRLMMR